MINQPETDGRGNIRISSDVIAVIAGTAASEIEGTVFSSNMLGKKKFGKGIRVKLTEDSVALDVTLCVKFGCKIQEVAEAVQRNITTAVETMTGLTVQEVNIGVTYVAFNKTKRGKANGAKK